MSVRAVPAALEAMVTTAPERLGTIRLITARDTKNTPLALTANVAAQSASVRSVAFPRRSTPAPLTNWSIGPRASSTSATMRSTPALVVTSAGNALTRSPSAASFAATSSNRSPSLSTAATEAPRSARVRTTAAPIPPAAPVTSAIFSRMVNSPPCR